MSRRRYDVDDWRRVVFADPHISDPTRVLLLLLAEHMRPDMTVSISREQLAAELGRSERRLADRFAEAVAQPVKKQRDKLSDAELRCRQEHRLLDRKSRGQKHVQAVYQALVPQVLSATHVCPAEDPQKVTAEHPEIRPWRPAENGDPDSQQDTRGARLTTADLSLPGQHHDGGSKDEHADARTVGDLASAWWLREPPDHHVADQEATA